jgi:hypothetical protein
MFCFVQRVVCCQKQAFGHPHGSTVSNDGSGYTDTRSDPASAFWISLMRKPESLDSKSHFFGCFECASGIGSGENDRDLLSAVAGSYVRSAHAPTYGSGDGTEAVISDLVPVTVIELFEMVEIDATTERSASHLATCVATPAPGLHQMRDDSRALSR